MASTAIEPEVREALECIERNLNFVLTGGAGSGKTYSLISLIEKVGEYYPMKSIVCITYTNNAVAEIRNRITNDKLQVSTIHEFVWTKISKYQNEMKKVLTDLINDESEKKFRLPKDFEEDQQLTIDYFVDNKIKYDEYYSLKNNKDSKISHDHVLIVAEKMFERYPKLCDILKDTANFIFVDEYQDTDPLIMKIFLDHIKQSNKNSIVGFFGDPMQAIYDSGVGKIDEESYENLVFINKKQNRRNPGAVINLANKIRNDSIKQEPSRDPNAPNMIDGKVIQGNINFLYTKNLDEISDYRKIGLFNEWDFSDSRKTKELWLVHRSNAKMAGFQKLFNLYNSDLIIELISKIRDKVKKGILSPGSESFENLASDITVRKRGNLLENIKSNADYNEAFSWIKNKKWDEVTNVRVNKDSLLSYKFNGLTGVYEAKSDRDEILKYLDSIYELIELYVEGNYNHFLKKIDIKILSFDKKKKINDEMNKLLEPSLTIEQVVEKAEDIFKLKNDSFEYFVNNEGEYLWLRLKALPFSEYRNSIKYQKENFPFATQHSIKGSEFDNVLVVLDNGEWSKYNFEKMFKNFSTNDSIVERTKKIFYVCCTRPKKNLVVLMPTVDDEVIERAKDLFGETNVHQI
ncbi:UvrD-helicase domain-containing protein [Vagococcus fessus]|uniref:DNA helicase UvrD n=1 Tax=Vagococcus fessus TaxID=120370 RepID=A0A430A688_9ENTE|nr:UvrD-helicase domain-containing protein [Vagococcus fessus]RSU02417.1 DNA helicase UvrD [Vagococcus fessus]